MAKQTTPAEAAKRIMAGEQPAAALGVTREQVLALVALGYNKYQQGRLDDAEVIFRGVAGLDATSYLGFAGVGAVALAKKPADLETAYTNLAKAAELKPDDGTVQANLGEVLLRQGKIEQAKTHMEKAFALDPDRKDPGVNRARALVAGLALIVQEAEKRQARVDTAKAS